MDDVRAAPAARRGALPREVWILAAVAFCVAIGYGIVAPAIPGFARQFGVTRTLAALVISMFALARLTTALGGGRLVDRFGGRPVLGAGLLVVALSSALAGLSGSYWQLLTLRGAGGVGSAMFTIASASVLAARVPSATRGRAMSVYSGGFLLGGITGPAIGGPMTEISLRLPFFFYAATLGVAAVITFALLGGPSKVRRSVTRDAQDPAAAPAEGAREALRIRLFRAATVANFSANWSNAVRTATVPLFVTEVLLRGEAWTGYGMAVFATANGLMLVPAGKLSDGWGRRPAMIVGAGLTSVGLLLLALDGGLWVFFASMVIGGVGASMQVVGPAAVAGDIARGRRGSVLASYQMAGDVGVVFGPIAVNFVVDNAGYTWAFALSSLIAASAAAFAVASRERAVPASG
ncbi:MFS transporter [Cumulibacter manganitolerans]|uniref:MFS transporter n=1 Tax=Cumulibacter manganitolerans TaxID=1884992 RepID=UPI001885FA6D|nr:MFS transporter [Cumulibacter manganitolerans]